MPRDISVMFKASDNLSKSLLDMKTNVKGLSRDISECQKIQDDAFKKRIEIKLDFTKAKNELKDFEIAFKNGNESAKQSFKEKQQQVYLLSKEYNKLSCVIKDAGSQENKLQGYMIKTSNMKPTRGGTDMLSTLGMSELGKFGGDIMGEVFLRDVSSQFGENIGESVSTVVGTAIQGASIGSAYPGIGTVVGGIIGLGLGLIEAESKEKEKVDEVFRDEINIITSGIKETQARRLEEGKAYSSAEEPDKKYFQYKLGEEEGTKFFDEIKSYGINTTYQQADIINSSRQMLDNGMGKDKVMTDIKMIGDIAMGDQQKFDSLSYAYSQIQSSGVLREQDLMQMMQAGFNPLKELAEDFGSLENARNHMLNGEISADMVTKAMKQATGEGGDYENGASLLMETYNGKQLQLNNIIADTEANMGRGWQESMMPIMDDKLKFYNDNPEKLEQMYKMLGEQESKKDKAEWEAEREAYENLFVDLDFQKALESGDTALMKETYEKYMGEGIINFKNSEAMTEDREIEMNLISNIQEVLRDSKEYLKQIAEKKNLKTKGLGFKEQDQNSNFNYPGGSVDKGEWEKNYTPSAVGLERVPYDNYPALLHEGEKVLTRQEAERQKEGKSNSFSFNIEVNNSSGNVYQITEEICRQIIDASENFAER